MDVPRTVRVVRVWVVVAMGAGVGAGAQARVFCSS